MKIKSSLSGSCEFVCFATPADELATSPFDSSVFVYLDETGNFVYRFVSDQTCDEIVDEFDNLGIRFDIVEE